MAGERHLKNATWGDSVEDVLREAHEAGDPDLDEQEITRRILDSGRKRPRGKTPARSVNHALNNDARNRFRRVSRGRYALATRSGLETVVDTPQGPAGTKMTTRDRRDEKGTWAQPPSGEPTGGRMFDDVSTEAILRRVSTKLEEEDARTLWRRVDSEFASGGSKGVTTYLRARFGELDARLRRELAAAKDKV